MFTYIQYSIDMLYTVTIENIFINTLKFYFLSLRFNFIAFVNSYLFKCLVVLLYHKIAL